MADAAVSLKRYVWQECLDIEAQAAGHYKEYVNTSLLSGIGPVPRRVLELGCAAGPFGAELKKRFPQATVVGIEAGREAAALAATRLDRVICARLESVDLAAEGLRHGEFDLVIAADILEHVVNPWDVLARLRPYLAADGYVLASIPNVRNLLLVQSLLVGGQWEYAERGLLDITHLRFFTLSAIRRLFEETGYRVVGHAATLSPDLVEFYRASKGQPLVTIDMGRLKLENVTPAELDELCAFQFLVRAQPA